MSYFKFLPKNHKRMDSSALTPSTEEDHDSYLKALKTAD